MKKLLYVFVLLLSSNAMAQSETLCSKGNFYLGWGWNRAWYTNSDIHFEGDGYDFTLYDVKAKDRQTDFSFDPYFHPLKLTIPQTNFKIGYFLSDDYTISIGFDHMKYVMAQNQTVNFEGEIENTHPFYDGYKGNTIVLSPNFLTYEHTDGLNYVNTELARYIPLYSNKLPVLGLVDIAFTQGIGAGVLTPRTDAHVMGKEKSDYFHLAGFGLSTMSGINISLFRYFYFQTEFKAGYINLLDVSTSKDAIDKAQQDFGFIQWNFTFGGRFNLSAFKK
ncbi:MAG: hypothetical protein ACI8ZO_001520 [Flavobacteriales bacterium]|jgi:hypothetical protein